ncbi:MAG: hypothetical protein ABR598_09310 [Candidatus Dormibacteria bacterium]
MTYLLDWLNIGPSRTLTVHCKADDWDFHPLYTHGECPICGWQPEGWPRPVPAWAAQLQGLQWDFVGLLGLFALLLALGYLVASAAGGLIPGR